MGHSNFAETSAAARGVGVGVEGWRARLQVGESSSGASPMSEVDQERSQ